MTANTTEEICFHKEKWIGTLILNRPAKLNTVTRAMGEQLTQIAQSINEDKEVRVVVLRGGGDTHFSAGSDIKALDHYGSPWELRNRLDYCAAIRSIRKPVIAMIRGYALGGGLELALSADIRIAAESANLGATEIKLGWIGGSGATQILPRLVGYGKAAEMVLTGEFLKASEAKELRLVEQLVVEERLEETTYALAARIAKMSPIAVEAAKQALRASWNSTLEQGLRYENELFMFCFTTEDSKEGIQAFADKREPNYKGR